MTRDPVGSPRFFWWFDMTGSETVTRSGDHVDSDARHWLRSSASVGARSLLIQASRPTHRRIALDLVRVEGRFRQAVEVIRDHQFDPGFDVQVLSRRLGWRSNAFYRVFRLLLGETPHRYIERGRMETAGCLLTNTTLRIGEVSSLLGYGHRQVFSDAFQRWTGLRPTAFRRNRLAGGEKDG